MRDTQHRYEPTPLPRSELDPEPDPDEYVAEAPGSGDAAMPIVPISARDLLAMEIAPRQLLMAPWLPRQGVTMVFAGRGIGKTHLAMSVAYTVAIGGTLMRWTAPAPRRVLYIDGEMPLGSLQERLAGIVAGVGRELPEPDFLAFLPQDHYRDGLPDVASEAGQALIKQCAEGRDLVVFDNLSSLVRLKENDADDWQPMQNLVLWLRRQGISTLIVHHAGKGGAQRGTSRREDVMDSVIELRRPEGYDPAEGARFEVHFTKARGFMGADAAPFLAAIVNDKGGAIRWEDADLTADDRAVAFEMFASGAKATEVEKALGVSRATAFRWQKAWKEGGGHG